MRWGIVGLALLALGCSKAESDGARDDVEASESAGPNVGVTQIPGVSLAYQYGFRLPVERIANVQEEHAAQCEALTASRCRVTGLTYNVGRDRRISGSLQLKLAPEIARRFGKKGVDTVVQRGGMLSEARIDSEESGAVIAAVDKDAAAIKAERASINEQLAKPGLGSAERTQLQERIAQLANEQRQSQIVRGETALKLASTPMTFLYQSGNVDPGLSDGPIIGAIKDGWANIISGVAIILTLLITLIPWAAIIALGIWLWKRFGIRLGLRRDPGAE
jgi:hypothetical protein